VTDSPTLASDLALAASGLRQWYQPRRVARARGTVTGPVRAVDGVDFHVGLSETVALVGESGCGKSTMARLLVGLEPPQDGTLLARRRDGSVLDIAGSDRRQRRRIGQTVQLVFQDPVSSLNPRMTIGESVAEPLQHQRLNGRQRRSRAAAALSSVGLEPGLVERFPHAMSGGQRQRVGIARALIAEPSILVCDEAVSALDVSVQAQVLNLLARVRAEHDLSLVFITHDLSVVRYLADRVAVMYVGQLVEVAPVGDLFARPLMPYTESLLAAIPEVGVGARGKPAAIRGEAPSPARPPRGCRFHPRCPYAIERCQTETPVLRPAGSGRLVACHRADELTLAGSAESIATARFEFPQHTPAPASADSASASPAPPSDADER
jgi:oligopeptide/dipeptide ABC transporter ATP-binding protein